MNKEKFLEFASKAFDLGAKFEINFYGSKLTEKLAKELADEFAQLVGGETKEKYNNDSTSRWFKIYGEHDMAVFHENSDIKKKLEVIA